MGWRAGPRTAIAPPAVSMPDPGNDPKDWWGVRQRAPGAVRRAVSAGSYFVVISNMVPLGGMLICAAVAP